jgi:hypothetical protein
MAARLAPFLRLATVADNVLVAARLARALSR